MLHPVLPPALLVRDARRADGPTLRPARSVPRRGPPSRPPTDLSEADHSTPVQTTRPAETAGWRRWLGRRLIRLGSAIAGEPGPAGLRPAAETD